VCERRDGARVLCMSASVRWGLYSVVRADVSLGYAAYIVRL